MGPGVRLGETCQINFNMVHLTVFEQCSKGLHESCPQVRRVPKGQFGGAKCTCSCHNQQPVNNLKLDQFFTLKVKQMNLPQSVTDRYVSSLVSAGYNNEFRIDSITCLPFVAEEVHCGHYFRASLMPKAAHDVVVSAGLTLHQAVRAALAKAGVTFR